MFRRSNIFRKTWTPEGSSEGVTQIKKGSYIDPLVMRFSPKSEFFIGNFHQNFSFLVKPYFLFLQYRKSVLKRTQIFGPLFEPCSSCVAVDSFSQKKTMSGRRNFLSDQKRHGHIIEQSIHMFMETYFPISSHIECAVKEKPLWAGVMSSRIANN